MYRYCWDRGKHKPSQSYPRGSAAKGTDEVSARSKTREGPGEPRGAETETAREKREGKAADSEKGAKEMTSPV